VGLSFLRGMVAAVNPCGFVLLPTYLVYFLGLEHRYGAVATQRATVRRALLVSGSVSGGFMAVFLAVGLVSYHFTNWINQHAQYATAVIAVGLIAMGVAMLFGWKLPVTTPRLDAGGRDRTVRSMFVYGIAYAVASIGCTLPLFLSTMFSTRRDGVLAGAANVVAYGAGMALLVSALTVTLAVANLGLVRMLRSASQYVETIAAVFVIVSGVYLLYYFWVVDLNEDTDPITDRVESFNFNVLNRLNDNWQTVAVLLTLVVGAAIAFVVISGRDAAREAPATSRTAPRGESDADAERAHQVRQAPATSRTAPRGESDADAERAR
jgi:cytochrome c-type biogenesis protein